MGRWMGRQARAAAGGRGRADRRLPPLHLPSIQAPRGRTASRQRTTRPARGHQRTSTSGGRGSALPTPTAFSGEGRPPCAVGVHDVDSRRPEVARLPLPPATEPLGPGIGPPQPPHLNRPREARDGRMDDAHGRDPPNRDPSTANLPLPRPCLPRPGPGGAVFGSLGAVPQNGPSPSRRPGEPRSCPSSSFFPPLRPLPLGAPAAARPSCKRGSRDGSSEGPCVKLPFAASDAFCGQ